MAVLIHTRIIWKGRVKLEDKESENQKKLLSSNIKATIASIFFHMVYSFVFGMLVGGKNIFIFLYNKDLIVLYMLLAPLIASLPYLLCGYLINLGRNSYRYLERKSFNLFMIHISIMLFIYLGSFIAQYFFPYHNLFSVYIFLNYPASAYLEAMNHAQYSQNLLVILSALLPPIMILIGGFIRIGRLKKGDIDE